MLGQTIPPAEGLRAAVRLSGSWFPSPGRAGQLRRRGRIQNHRSESNGRVRIRIEMTMIFGDESLMIDSIARVKEQEGRIL